MGQRKNKKKRPSEIAAELIAFLEQHEIQVVEQEAREVERKKRLELEDVISRARGESNETEHETSHKDASQIHENNKTALCKCGKPMCEKSKKCQRCGGLSKRKTKRNLEVLHLDESGKTAKEISEIFGISSERVMDIVRQYKRRRKMLELYPHVLSADSCVSCGAPAGSLAAAEPCWPSFNNPVVAQPG